MFVDAMDEKCGKTITMDGKIFHSANIQQTFRNNYALNTRCRVLFETMEPYRFIIVFKRLDIEFEPLCDDDNLQIFDGNSTSHPTIKGKVRSSPGAIKVRRLHFCLTSGTEKGRLASKEIFSTIWFSAFNDLKTMLSLGWAYYWRMSNFLVIDFRESMTSCEYLPLQMHNGFKNLQFLECM